MSDVSDVVPSPEPASPTGVAVLPPAVVPWALGAFGVLSAVVPLLPEHTLGARYGLAALVFLAGALGLSSPGLRRR